MAISLSVPIVRVFTVESDTLTILKDIFVSCLKET